MGSQLAEQLKVLSTTKQAVSMWEQSPWGNFNVKKSPWGRFNVEKLTLRQFQLPMQALEGLVRLNPPAPLNKDVGCHCLPHVLKHVCHISLCQRNACCKHRPPWSTRHCKREHVGCMQATTIQTSKAQAATPCNECGCLRNAVNVIGTQTGMHHIDICCNQGMEKGSRWTKSMHMEALLCSTHVYIHYKWHASQPRSTISPPKKRDTICTNITRVSFKVLSII